MRASWAALSDAGLPSQLDHRGATNAVHLTVVAAPALPDEALETARRTIGPLLPLRVRASGLLVLGGSRVTLGRSTSTTTTTRCVPSSTCGPPCPTAGTMAGCRT